MQLHIKFVRWAINRVTGVRTERTVFNGKVAVKLGEIEELSEERRKFFIEEINEKTVKLSVKYPPNPDADKTFLLEKGEREIYAPRSFGAGSIFYLLLK